MDSQVIIEAASISLTAISIAFFVITSLLVSIKLANFLGSRSFFISNREKSHEAAKAAAIAVTVMKFKDKNPK
ncbi:MAG: hypothetical protein ACJ0A3_01630 [Dehalococcoidia bacterium]